MCSPSVAIIIVSRNRPDLVERSVCQFLEDSYENKEILVVECGTDPENLTNYDTLFYTDKTFKGKCYGHNVGLNFLNSQKHYDYYLFCMNDVFIEKKSDFLQELVETMEADSSLAVLSPTERGSLYPGAQPVGVGTRAVTTCDYLFLLVRGPVVQRYGFLNPDFEYCWGAIHEYSYKLYSEGYYISYYDNVTYHHLGGSTYGAKATNTISREGYIKNAKNFAYKYFNEKYGTKWDDEFWITASSQYQIDHNTYKAHRDYWGEAADEQ